MHSSGLAVPAVVLLAEIAIFAMNAADVKMTVAVTGRVFAVMSVSSIRVYAHAAIVASIHVNARVIRSVPISAPMMAVAVNASIVKAVNVVLFVKNSHVNAFRRHRNVL